MTHRFASTLLVAVFIVAVAAWSVPGALGLAAPAPIDPVNQPGTDAAAWLAAEPAADKLAESLRLAADAEPERDVLVFVASASRLDAPAGAVVLHRWSWPAGEDLAVVRLPARLAPTLADRPEVMAVMAGDPADMTQALPDEEWAERSSRVDPAELGRMARRAPAWSTTVTAGTARAAAAGTAPAAGADRAVGDGDEGKTQGWFDVGRGHAAREAWDLGYRGEGVRVAVLDYAVDFAHPDLQGTWAVLPPGHPYEGWPQVYDPAAGYQAVLDKERAEAERSTRTAASGMIELYQTAQVVEATVGATTTYTACLQPLLARSSDEPRVLGEPVCDYQVPPTSIGGTVRFGHHPDTILRDAAADPEAGIAGEWAGVLAVDQAAAGVYDTVYVDVDGDHDFGDEKPMSRDDPLSWRDLNGDGLADISGGLLYFVSDGALPFPGSWLWGLEEEVPAAGQVIGILYVTGDHGTLCASNIVSQGVLGVPANRRIAFADLGGDGQPPSLNLGTAPDAALVSIGSVYASGSPIFAASWRYAVLGHDPDRADDDIQVTSNSYGFSGTDNDGWDADSRLVDHYVRTFAPQTSFLMSTGNGGFGYGTNAPPSPVVAMGIAASTQFGSTGGESISDTMQITYADITPFSNRGPSADGRNGVSVAANGDNGTGAEPVNFVGDGAASLALWGGTSRSCPVAAGVMTLVYQAFQEKHERWPTWQEAQAILMSGARYAGYDTFTMGAGVVDAADSVRIASGRHGIYSVPPAWTPGSYRGTTYEAFARLVERGQSVTASITLANPASAPVDVSLSAATPRLLASHEMSLTTDLAGESPASPVPDYLLRVPAEAIPEGTELMVVRGRYPYGEFDVNGDYTIDNRYDLGVLQHTDRNGDGELWVDANDNAVVNHRQMLDSFVDARWTGGQRQIESLEGDITVPLPDGGLSGGLAWFGRGCANDQPIQDVAGQVALIARGVCTFAEKILHAQSLGAVGVVVFSDDRPKQALVGDAAGIQVPGVMIDRQPGLVLAGLLEAGTPVTVTLMPRRFTGVGLSGAGPVVYEDSEIQQWEYNRLSRDNDGRNHWAVPIHHPIERWSDGLYVGAWHVGRTSAVTTTHIALRLDFYGYQEWPELTLDHDTVSIPAGGSVEVGTRLDVQDDWPPGALQGAIFADYGRADGDVANPPGSTPGGYELEVLRTVVPVNVNVAAPYDWRGSRVLGGVAGDDPSAPYDNGAMWGAFKWDWRPESGDWRFYFADASEPADNTFLLLRTQWTDPITGRSDIDTRVLAPTPSRFSNPSDPGNAEEDWSDPAWYGPYSLALLARSPYLVHDGSIWPFNTTSGANDDWLIAPARAGLHEVMLHNVLSSGGQFAMPFTTTLGALRLNAVGFQLYGDGCSSLDLTPEMALDGFSLAGFGMGVPQVITDVVAVADVEDDVNSSTFRHDVVLETPAGGFTVTLDGDEDDDLDLFLLHDANGDGTFAYQGEVVARSTGQTADERLSVSGIAPAGHYQVWVHGFRVVGEGSTFDLTIHTVSGRSLLLAGTPVELPVGRTSRISVCADVAALEGSDGPATGLIVGGPAGAPTLLRLPVTWVRGKPTVYLPSVGIRGPGEP